MNSFDFIYVLVMWLIVCYFLDQIDNKLKELIELNSKPRSKK